MEPRWVSGSGSGWGGWMSAWLEVAAGPGDALHVGAYPLPVPRLIPHLTAPAGLCLCGQEPPASGQLPERWAGGAGGAALGPGEAASVPHPRVARAGGSRVQSWGLRLSPSQLPGFLPSALRGPDLPETPARGF